MPKKSMQKYCCFHDCDFQSLTEITEEKTGRNTEDSSHLILTDAPSRFYLLTKNSKSDHDQFTEQNMQDLVYFADTVLNPGSHVHIFGSAMQFYSYSWVQHIK